MSRVYCSACLLRHTQITYTGIEFEPRPENIWLDLKVKTENGLLRFELQVPKVESLPSPYSLGLEVCASDGTKRVKCSSLLYGYSQSAMKRLEDLCFSDEECIRVFMSHFANWRTAGFSDQIIRKHWRKSCNFARQATLC